MSKQIIIIEGNNFSDLDGFFNEIDRVLTKNLDWQTGHNFNAFNDLLRGGFGVHDYEEPITLIWKNAGKSKNDLGLKARENRLKQQISDTTGTQQQFFKDELKDLEKNKKPTFSTSLSKLLLNISTLNSKKKIKGATLL